MTSMRVPFSLAVIAGLSLACAHRNGSDQTTATPAPDSVPPPTSMLSPARQSATSLDQMLAGRIAGVQVTRAAQGGISVLIRGPTSFYLSSEPLYVVDDVPVRAGPGGSLSWLRPEDIASIVVLKDAAASIYGVQGANGVIVIKTKGTH